MSGLGPSGNDQDSGLQRDVGVDLHVWTTRWDQIEDDHADAPQEALEDAADLLEEMFQTLDVPTEAADAPETEDVVGRLNREAPVDREEIDDAFDEARRTFDLLVTGRRASGEDAGL